MKLAIYGDSYFDPKHGHNDPTLEKYAWVNLLKEHYDVIIFGKVASGVYYSFKKFLDTHSDFDRIIFGATVSARWGHGFDVNGKERHFNNLMATKNFLNSNLNQYPDHLIKQIKALNDYYNYLVDLEHTNIMKNLMVDEVKRIRPDAIIMDIGHDPIFYYIELQKKYFGISKEYPLEIRCVCHFTKEFNQALYRNVLNKLSTGDWGELETNVNVLEDFSYYFSNSKNI